jgi:glutaminyl-tRNA synthetase
MPRPVKAVPFTKDEATGAVTEIQAAFDRESKKKLKTYIQWVPNGSPAAEVRIYRPLFRSDQPGSAPGGLLKDIRPDSETVWLNTKIETGFDEVRRRAPWPEAKSEQSGDVGPESVRFQAMRVGYFVCDRLGALLVGFILIYVVSCRPSTRRVPTAELSLTASCR